MNDNLFDPTIEYTQYADLPPERVFNGAMAQRLKILTIVGRTHTGELYVATTYAKRAETYYDLAQASKLIEES